MMIRVIGRPQWNRRVERRWCSLASPLHSDPVTSSLVTVATYLRHFSPTMTSLLPVMTSSLPHPASWETWVSRRQVPRPPIWRWFNWLTCQPSLSSCSLHSPAPCIPNTATYIHIPLCGNTIFCETKRNGIFKRAHYTIVILISKSHLLLPEDQQNHTRKMSH